MVPSLVKTVLKNSLIINSLYDLNEKSLVEKLEARFINLHPRIQQLFFKLESMEKGEDKDFLDSSQTLDSV